MRLYGFLAEILLNIDPEKYGDKVVIEKGKKIVYTVMRRTLYRVMISSLLFWRYLVRKLKSWGFQTNPYDPCVMNKVVNGKY